MENYQKEIHALLQELKVTEKNGLTDEAIRQNQKLYGENKILSAPKTSIGLKFLATLKDVTAIILLSAAIISFITMILDHEGGGKYFEGLLILGIVFLNSTLAIFQEGKAEEALASLKDLNKSTVKVRRNGQLIAIDTSQLVVGDILQLQNGNKIPADARLLESVELQIDESTLTGESLPVGKDASFQTIEPVDLGDRRNMVYSGTTIVNGHGRAVVTDIGMQSELGKIATYLRQTGTQETPLQLKLKQLGKRLSLIALFAAILVLVIGFYRQMDLLHVFMVAVSLAVAVVPETLPIIVTMTLAIGVRRMAKKQAIIRRLPAVETLGATTVIASDKTGTLTQNKMTVTTVWVASENQIVDLTQPLTDVKQRNARSILKMTSLSTNVDRNMETGQFEGLPTEVAIANALDNFEDKEALDRQNPKLHQIPFNSTRKRMTTVHRMADGRYAAITKGAFDVLYDLMVDDYKDAAIKINEQFGLAARRVLTVMVKYFETDPSNLTESDLEVNARLLGLIGIIDPPRLESKPAVIRAKRAGVRTVMVTGDHLATASAIAAQIGILTGHSQAITGVDLRQLSDETLIEQIENYRVFARVTPSDKIRIVQALQAKGNVVAMTGDGVNDAPALKAADVGIAMGKTGTDVAREAADIVLADDNFVSIVDAMEQGRGIYDKIKKTINFLLSVNISEIFVILIALLVGWGSPLLPVHILFINLIADGLPGFALSYEPTDSEVMKRKPVPRKVNLFANGLGLQIALHAVIFAIVTLTGIWIGQFTTLTQMTPSLALGQTMAFTILSLTSIIHVFNIRSTKSIFETSYKANPLLFKMAGLSLAITLIIAITPGIQVLFSLIPMNLLTWGYVLILSLIPTISSELIKLVIRK